MARHIDAIEFKGLTDLELLSLICIGRVFYTWERDKLNSLLAARMHIRMLPEFSFARPANIDQIDHRVDVYFPAETGFVRRAVSVLTESMPSEEIFTDISVGNEISAAKLVVRTMFALGELPVDAFLPPFDNKLADVGLEHLQQRASFMQQDCYSSYVYRRLSKPPAYSPKLSALQVRGLKIAINLFSMSDYEIGLCVSAIGAKAERLVTIDRISVDDILAGALGRFDIFITNNNFLYDRDVEQLRAIGEASECLTVCWHWDNHHQFDFSGRLVQVFDIIFPAHSTSQMTLHAGRCLVGPCIPCCALQWPAEMASELGINLSISRSDMLYGSFNAYPGRIGLRDKFLKNISKLDCVDVMVVSYLENDWVLKSQKEKFFKLAAYKSMICNPIYNDVPARMFDALLVGASCLLPYGLPDLAAIFSRDEQKRLGIIRYLPDNEASLLRAHHLSLERFNNAGLEGVSRRHKAVLENHMLHHRVAEIVAEICSLIEIAE